MSRSIVREICNRHADGFAPADVVNGEPVASANVASPLFRKTLIVCP